MQEPPGNATLLSTKIRIQPNVKSAFADWQARLNATIAAFPGFVSLEILSPTESSQHEWVIVQRFYSSDNVIAWRNSKERLELMESLKKLVADGADAIQEAEIAPNDLLKGGVTEVFITQVSPDKDRNFRKWIAKIHQVEAKFPGFRGVYVQSPGMGPGKNWITLLQFDTPENLDRWLFSDARQQVLDELKPLITSIESHRVISSYAGWFSSIAKKGDLPPVWKQTMIVLLVLFPIVMFELRYLSPLTLGFGTSLAMFIGNAISVTLISWPMMPIAIYFLGWWLTPDSDRLSKTIIGTIVVMMLYLLEIAILWKFV